MKNSRALGSEPELVRRIAALAGPSRAPLITGIGDDCTVFRPRPGEDLLFTTDLLIEDVHFTRTSHTASEVGHKALARGLSDIAAMGGDPRFCLVSIALAEWNDRQWVDGFYRGLLRLARKFDCALAGGDLSHTTRLTCDIVVCGSAPKGRALLRSGARAGHSIYVSGPLGKPWQTHRRPMPRIILGRSLRGAATAAMDLSDGLSLDLSRLCEASKVAAELDTVPVVRGSTLEQALHGGEDYELIFTLPPRRAAPKGTHRIGTIVAGTPGEVRLNGSLVPRLGYDHFRQ